MALTLGVAEDRVYCAELDAGRVEKIKERMPKANVIGPVTFIGGVLITGYSFGLAYVNPPFDFEFGGGRREEETFFERAAKLLCTHGVMVLVVPIKVFIGNRSFVEAFDMQFSQDTAIFKFPDGQDQDGNKFRPYNEIVVIGRKRRTDSPRDGLYQHGILHKMQCHYNGYISLNSLPPSASASRPTTAAAIRATNANPTCGCSRSPCCIGPHSFKKDKATDEELVAWMKESPLNKH